MSASSGQRMDKSGFDAEKEERAAAEIEVLRHERDRAEAYRENVMRILLGIHMLVQCPDITASDGKVYRFVDPNAAATLAALSERIRAIPDELAKAAPPSPPAQELTDDTARLEWLTHRLAGSEARRLGIITSSGGLQDLA